MTRRGLVFLGVLFGMGGLFILLPPEQSSIFFGIAVVGLLAYAAQTYRVRIPNFYTGRLAAPPTLQLRRLSFIASLPFWGLAILFFAPTRYYSDALHGWIFVLLGTATLGLALAGSPDAEAPDAAHVTDPPRPIAKKTLVAGCVCILITMQANIGGTPFLALMATHLQFGLFISGLVLIAASLSGYAWASLRTMLRQAWQTVPHSMRQWLQHNRVLVAIVVLASVVRVINLEYGLHRLVDEIHFMTAVADLRSEPNVTLLTQHGGVTAFSWLYPYFQSLLVELFGAGLSPIRIVSGFFGVAEVVALYALIRATFDRRTALLAALLLATFPPHVHFSRLALNNIVDPLFGLLAMWCLVRGMQTHRQAYFAVGGIMLGMTHYFYEGGRLFFVPFVLAWLGWLFLTLPRAQRDRLPSRRNLLIFGAALLITIFPMYYIWEFFDLPLTARFAAAGGSFQLVETLLLSPQPHEIFWERLHYPLMFYTFLEEGGSFYTGTRIILYETLPLFLLGWAWCFWRARSMGGGLLFWWVMGQAIAIVFVKGTLATPRYCVVYPALAAVMAVGLVQVWQLGITLWQKRDTPPHVLPDLVRSSKIWVIPLLIGIGVALYQGWQYLNVIQPRYYQLQFYPETDRGFPVKDADDALFRMVALPPETDVFLVAEHVSGVIGFDAFLRFYSRNKNSDFQLVVMTPDVLTRAYLEDTTPSRTRAFFVEPDDLTTIQRLRDYFPTLDGPIYSPFPVPIEKQFALYRVAPQ